MIRKDFFFLWKVHNFGSWYSSRASSMFQHNLYHFSCLLTVSFFFPSTYFYVVCFLVLAFLFIIQLYLCKIFPVEILSSFPFPFHTFFVSFTRSSGRVKKIFQFSFFSPLLSVLSMTLFVIRLSNTWAKSKSSFVCILPVLNFGKMS